MGGLDKIKPAFAALQDEGRDKVKQQSNSSLEENDDIPSLDDIKNWEERDGNLCVKKIETISTPLWRDGWYRNPTSGRSNNYGVHTGNPREHFTLVTKGGCFFVDERCKEFFKNNPISLNELYGGISFDAARKEHDIAALIQHSFQSLLQKKANCPEPIDVKAVTHVLNDQNEAIELAEFFLGEVEKEEGKIKFTAANFVHLATRLGVDVLYPMSEEADQSVKDDAFGWLFRQCLEKEKQGVYRYKIQGPNTRLLDLMTLDLPDRRKHFIEASDAVNIRNAVEGFASKLGEFYGVLHKSNISYHGKSSEHCTLVDITISGVIMDIGGLSQDNSASPRSESYLAQLIETTNLLAYLCKNILKLNNDISERAVRAFWKTYKTSYADETLEYFLKLTDAHEPDKIRTHYFDTSTNDWVALASDLKDLAWEG